MLKEYVKRSRQESLEKLTKDVPNEIHLTFIKISTKVDLKFVIPFHSSTKAQRLRR